MDAKLLLIIAASLHAAATSIEDHILAASSGADASADTSATEGTLDASGVPWDARIHAPSKVLTKNGCWRLARGVDPELVKTVTKELLDASADPAGGAVATDSNLPADSALPASGDLISPAQWQQTIADVSDSAKPLLPVAPVAPVAPPAPPAPAAPKSAYQQLVEWLAANTGPGKAMTADAVNMMLSGSGTSIAALAADQDASAKWLNYFIQVSSPTV